MQAQVNFIRFVEKGIKTRRTESPIYFEMAFRDGILHSINWTGQGSTNEGAILGPGFSQRVQWHESIKQWLEQGNYDIEFDSIRILPDEMIGSYNPGEIAGQIDAMQARMEQLIQGGMMQLAPLAAVIIGGAIAASGAIAAAVITVGGSFALEAWKNSGSLPIDHPDADPDGDGIPNRLDGDDDGDGSPDGEDSHPYDPGSSIMMPPIWWEFNYSGLFLQNSHPELQQMVYHPGMKAISDFRFYLRF